MNYPLGAEYHPDAPYNQKNVVESRDINMTICQSLSKTYTINTDEDNFSEANLERERNLNHVLTPLELIQECAKLAEDNKYYLSIINSPDKTTIKAEMKNLDDIINQCKSWVIDDYFIDKE